MCGVVLGIVACSGCGLLWSAMFCVGGGLFVVGCGICVCSLLGGSVWDCLWLFFGGDWLLGLCVWLGFGYVQVYCGCGLVVLGLLVGLIVATLICYFVGVLMFLCFLFGRLWLGVECAIAVVWYPCRLSLALLILVLVVCCWWVFICGVLVYGVCLSVWLAV